MTQRGGDEPDYRFTLANERTFLAWIRTALALLAAGVGVVALPGRFSNDTGRRVLGVMLVLLACTAAAAAYRRWRGNDRAIRADLPLPRSQAVPVLAVGLVLVMLTAFALVLADI